MDDDASKMAQQQEGTTTTPPDDQQQGMFGAVLAGITKSLVYGLKSIPRTLVKASLHKQAFLTLSRRTFVGSPAEVYRYDGKRLAPPRKLTLWRRVRGRSMSA